jgi:hypothetical protein
LSKPDYAQRSPQAHEWVCGKVAEGVMVAWFKKG